MGAARNIFDSMEAKSRDIVTWSSMIMALGGVGRGEEALALFRFIQMPMSEGGGGLSPNGHTLLLILSACSHAGLLDEGVALFESARESGVHFLDFHFNALLDLLARGGRLHEAERIINEMPMRATAITWMTLLGGCRMHGCLEIAECTDASL